MLIQCTKKLLDQLKIKPAEPKEEETLFSWHANLIIVNRRKTVVLVNDSNRYVIVLYGLKAKDLKKIDELILQAIKETFEEECIKSEIIDKFINQSKEIVYTKTKNKTSVARMNKSCEVVYYVNNLLRQDSICQTDASMCISRSLIGNGKNNYITPSNELFKDLEDLEGKPIFRGRAVQLKVTMDLENNNVWRRLVVPINTTFKKLHEVLQAAFGWKNYHLHEFYIYDDSTQDKLKQYYSPYHKKGYKPIINLVCNEEAFDYLGEIPMKLEKNIKLREYIPEFKNIKYNYDFGDSWSHYIEVEKMIDDYDKNYAVCLEGEGKTPPEDVGGEYGYEEFLEIISNKDHPDHKGMLDWAESQGYEDFDIDDVNMKIKLGTIF
ncbi:plasmid pRiA4b ORF-3 family protein [Haloimpatiens sp. FM7330]|uniref:plasmid pRiA4b ORF-3 family protein n=1 Tax=Haloimpatiens sp. FM7330 TaxID=3298610 RepID=UPI003629881A